jgi:hypothetical protein
MVLSKSGKKMSGMVAKILGVTRREAALVVEGWRAWLLLVDRKTGTVAAAVMRVAEEARQINDRMMLLVPRRWRRRSKVVGAVKEGVFLQRLF